MNMFYVLVTIRTRINKIQAHKTVVETDVLQLFCGIINPE